MNYVKNPTVGELYPKGVYEATVHSLRPDGHNPLGRYGTTRFLVPCTDPSAVQEAIQDDAQPDFPLWVSYATYHEMPQVKPSKGEPYNPTKRHQLSWLAIHAYPGELHSAASLGYPSKLDFVKFWLTYYQCDRGNNTDGTPRRPMPLPVIELARMAGANRDHSTRDIDLLYIIMKGADSHEGLLEEFPFWACASNAIAQRFASRAK